MLLKSPVVVKLAPLVSERLPLLLARPEIAAIVAPVPSREMFAWLVVMLVPLGKARVEPLRAFQVPPVRVLLETCAIVPAETESSRIGLDSAGVDELTLNPGASVPVPAVFSNGAGVVDDIRVVQVVNPGVGFDQVGTAGFDH